MDTRSNRRNIYEDDSFKELYKLHWSRIYRLCLYYCADQSDAKDMTQNIFVSVWERELVFPEPKAAEVFLSKAARFQVLKYHRDKKLKQPVTEHTGYEDKVEVLRYNPETLYTLKEFSLQVHDQVDALQEPGRTIFILSRMQEKTYREIGMELGIAVKTVEKHMSKALFQLRSVLIPHTLFTKK